MHIHIYLFSAFFIVLFFFFFSSSSPIREIKSDGGIIRRDQHVPAVHPTAVYLRRSIFSPFIIVPWLAVSSLCVQLTPSLHLTPPLGAFLFFFLFCVYTSRTLLVYSRSDRVLSARGDSSHEPPPVITPAITAVTPKYVRLLWETIRAWICGNSLDCVPPTLLLEALRGSGVTQKDPIGFEDPSRGSDAPFEPLVLFSWNTT